MKKAKQYVITPARGQALLNYQGRLMPSDSVAMTLYETEIAEEVRREKATKKPGAEKQKELNPDFRNLLIHGDCMSACAYLKEKDVRPDLVYIDPPFASGANYAKKIYLRNGGKEAVPADDRSIGEEIMYGDIWQKEDYLNYLYERLLAIREVMAETASIYVHLDWHIGHYAKILLDEVFGEENFVNEIIWYYKLGMKARSKKFHSHHDTIFWYTKNKEVFAFNEIRMPLENIIKRPQLKFDSKTKKAYQMHDENGKPLYIESTDELVGTVWDILNIAPMSQERSGYTTQKPEALLERIIKASSDEGMIVADFFAGSGTAAKVAHDLGRKFVACDVGVNAIQTARDRLAVAGAEFDVLKVRDGVRLFRNPAQTAARLFSLIDGFKDRVELDLSDFWDGGVAGKGKSFTPVKFIGLDKKLTRKMLDVIMEEVYRLEDIGDEEGAVKIIYAYKDDDVDQSCVNRERDKAGKTMLSVEIMALDDLLGEKREMLFTEDSADVSVKKEKDGGARVEIKRYFSPYLKAKIDEYNKKKTGRGQQTLAGGQAQAAEVRISASGLELIESVQFDTTLKKNAVWTSNLALEDKAGVKEKIKGAYLVPTGAFKMKIRSIAGDEIILNDTD